MNDAPEAGPGVSPADLRFLKRLVTVLAGTMILGLITIMALLVIRLQAVERPAPVLPEAVSLPEGVTPEAITFGRGWYAVVTSDDRILIFDADSHKMLSETAITLPR
ncbi:DUF6476 family protein [Albidovulum sediminicola]|uniref:DUF6476 family protein n=1 Tax=Albidovulum sediminicola TaxID=2984331 RepID=A0ABT2YZZ4_9RHOB|nr:DUF6476 family protein [Defluviimonas sp. WL0075]MCV2864454.1 DUF6476 family protein [Defluviimonas sp. WL0075]